MGTWALLPRLTVLGLVVTGCTWSPRDVQSGDREAPRLILQITVDQLRGDLLHRYHDRFGDGGFRYLLEQGTVDLDASHHSGGSRAG